MLDVGPVAEGERLRAPAPAVGDLRLGLLADINSIDNLGIFLLNIGVDLTSARGYYHRSAMIATEKAWGKRANGRASNYHFVVIWGENKVELYELISVFVSDWGAYPNETHRVWLANDG